MLDQIGDAASLDRQAAPRIMRVPPPAEPTRQLVQQQRPRPDVKGPYPRRADLGRREIGQAGGATQVQKGSCPLPVAEDHPQWKGRHRPPLAAASQITRRKSIDHAQPGGLRQARCIAQADVTAAATWNDVPQAAVVDPQGRHLLRRKMALRQELFDQPGLHLCQTCRQQSHIARPFQATGPQILVSLHNLGGHLVGVSGQQFHASVQALAGGLHQSTGHRPAVAGNMQAQQSSRWPHALSLRRIAQR